jgi:hypothetical protein
VQYSQLKPVSINREARVKKYWVIAPYDSTDSKVFDAAWQYDRENDTIAVGWRDVGNIEEMSLEEYQKHYEVTRPKL